MISMMSTAFTLISVILLGQQQLVMGQQVNSPQSFLPSSFQINPQSSSPSSNNGYPANPFNNINNIGSYPANPFNNFNNIGSYPPNFAPPANMKSNDLSNFFSNGPPQSFYPPQSFGNPSSSQNQIQAQQQQMASWPLNSNRQTWEPFNSNNNNNNNNLNGNPFQQPMDFNQRQSQQPAFFPSQVNSFPPSNNVQKPKECVPIDSVSACAPWNKGYYVNITEMARIYSDHQQGSVFNVSQWDRLVGQTTNGSPLQTQMWTKWAACNGYRGDPIQYLRTYVCLTDIFLFSSGCNDKPPTPSLCPGTCQIYGKAVEALMRDQVACPAINQTDSRFNTIMEHRSRIGRASQNCQNILNKYNSAGSPMLNNFAQQQSTFSKINQDKYVAGYSAEHGQYHSETACPSDRYIVSVFEDSTSCGFSGNMTAALEYCEDFQSSPCCKKLKNIPTFAGLRNSQNQFLNTEEKEQKDVIGKLPDGTKIGLIVGGCVLGVLVVAGLVFAGISIRKRRSSKDNFNKYDPLLVSESGKKSDRTIMSATKTTSSTKKTTTQSNMVPDQPSPNDKYIVTFAHTKSLPDEMQLNAGDMIRMDQLFDDLWAKGENMTTGEKGYFPSQCVKKIE